ncbi:MAG: DUF3348 family protein [Burkholderiaceae bacterium]
MTGQQARETRRILPTGSALVRALAALGDAPLASPKDAVAERLSRWFDWTDAIALSAALGTAAAPGAGAGTRASAVQAQARELARARAALEKLVAQTFPDPAAAAVEPARRPAPASTQAGRRQVPARGAAPGAVDLPDPADGFGPYRDRCAAVQQAMQQRLGPLRQRLRTAVGDASPALARLAAVDAVMEQVVGERERALAAVVARRLEQHYERLRAAHTDADADTGSRTGSASWPARLAQAAREVLLAELDFRMQAPEGLLDALRGALPPHTP